MQADKRKTVFVIVHGDIWGAYNANQLLPALEKRGCNIFLMVSRSTPDKNDGCPANKNMPGLRPFLAAKENLFLSVCNAIDATRKIGRDKSRGRFLTFNALATRFAKDKKIRWTTHGGLKGGYQIAAHFTELESFDIVPDLVLSGDTLAVLPASITDRYPCFGTHPGPLPEIPGMHGTERSLLHNRLFDQHGNPNPQHTLPYVKGSFFNLAAKLDDGPVIAYAMAPCITGMTFLQLRQELYSSLIKTMIDHLDVLLDDGQRKDLVNDRTQNPLHKSNVTSGHHVPELAADQLSAWASDGFMGIDGDESFVQQNAIFDPVQLKNWMREFCPPKWTDAEFDKMYDCGVSAIPLLRPKPPAKKLWAARTALVVPGTDQFAAGIKRLIDETLINARG